MSQRIGYQDGLDWFVGFLRKIPGVKYRPAGDRPASLEQWYGLEKFERTLRILKDDHDAAIVTEPPLPPPPPPPPTGYVKVAPITVRAEGGSDQRVCLFQSDGSLRPGVRRLANGEYTDDSGARYAADGGGLENSSIRSKVDDPRLVGARSMDNRSACDCPPVGWPTNNTGSWTV